MKALLFIFLAAVSVEGFAVCMRELDADAYGCVPMTHNPQAGQWCEQKFGEGYRAYVTDNICSKELAASLRGESFESAAAKTPETVKAACMTYEQGMENNCDYYDYLPAQRYCARHYGNRYIPFVPDNRCSLEKAARSRGEVPGERLVEGLGSPMDEIETIMTMIDREGLKNPLGILGSKKPRIGNEFYTDVVKALMAKMNMLKERLREKGELNVPLNDPHTLEYLRFAFRYLAVQARLFKVYAHVAHENHYALKTYSFENLEYLNLVLKKEHALEILAQVNYKAKTVEGGEAIEFSIGEQERQTFEFLALENPETKKDYAKLISYMGTRESLVNLWAVQRMTPADIDNGEVRGCGDFLSFRPGAGGMMEKSEAYRELFEYDLFYNDYAARWDELARASQEASLLNASSAADLGYYLFSNVGELKSLLSEQSSRRLSTEAEFREQARKDASMLMEAEDAYWRDFSARHFSTIVMPGDNVLDKDAVMERIGEEAYQKRLEAIKDVFVASYLWVSDEAVAEIQRRIQTFADRYLKTIFMGKIKAALGEIMQDYNSQSLLARENRDQKEKELWAAAKKAALAKNVLDAAKENKLNFKSMATLEPGDPSQLALLFQSRVEKDFADLKQTIAHNRKLAGELNEFLKEIAARFQRRFPEEAEKAASAESERAKALRRIAFETAKKWWRKYPFAIANYRLRPSPVIENILKSDSIPVYADGGAAATVSKEELLKAGETPTNYVESRAPLLAFFGATPAPKGGRNNPDKISSGEIGRPLEVVSPGALKTSKGYEGYGQAKLARLFERFASLSGLIERTPEQKESLGSKDAFAVDKMFVINEPGRFFFRVFEALRLEEAGMRLASYGRFAPDRESQLFLANAIVGQAYQAQPLLRSEVSWHKKFEKDCYSSMGMIYECDYHKEVKVPLLEKIAKTAYDPSADVFDRQKGKAEAAEAVDSAIEGTPEKLETFCKANYLNYENDPEFKKVFKAAKFLRASLRSGAGMTSKQAEKLQDFDHSVKKEIRGRWEAWNEDYFEPGLWILGTAALSALAVFMIIGSAGLATPGILGGIYAAAGAFLTLEFFVSFPLVAGSLYARMNVNFIETPAQLRFQTSLASSQIQGKIVDWDMLKQDKESNKKDKMWTVGLMPLDFLYGGMLVRHVQHETGTLARSAYQRLTGAKPRGWSAPPKSMLNNARFKTVRETFGFKNAARSQYRQSVNRVKSFMPKYQPLPKEMIMSAPLRLGFVRKARSLNVADRPWVFLDDIKDHVGKLEGRLQSFKNYSAAESAFVEKLRLKGTFRPGEVLAHFKQSSFYFLPASLVKRIKDRDVRGVVRFFTKFGDVWRELKGLQGEVIKERARSVQMIGKKLEDFKRAAAQGVYQGEDMTAKFLETLSDGEILALREVAKKSDGQLKHFKQVFKDHDKVVRGMRPMSYLNVYRGRPYGKPVYSSTYLFDAQIRPDYAFVSDAQDLIKFYESMMRNHGVKNAAMREARERAEQALAGTIKIEGGEASAF